MVVAMKEFCIKDLNRFLEISKTIDTPFKFFEIQYLKDNKEMIRAEIWLRTAIISWEGLGDATIKQRLIDNDFTEAELRETKKIIITELG